MSVNKFGEHYIARYTAYLNDVLKHFKTHRSLRKYSYIAQEHKITHMNTDVFQETELYHWVDKPLTREKVIEVIKSVDAHDSRKKKKESQQEHKFKDGELLSWDFPNKPRRFAFVGYNKNGEVYSNLISGYFDKDLCEDVRFVSCLRNKVHDDILYASKNCLNVKLSVDDYKIMVDILNREIYRLKKQLDKLTKHKD